jgi:DNA-binding NtrC family response regulator/cytochrome b subunit of formate dehydrogenase
MAGERVLILEDDPLLGTVLHERFRAEGWDAVLATRVAEARAAFDETEPDVVLSDLRLPDGDGIAFLREMAPRAGCAFVMMTAHATVASAVEALKLGAKDYLEKPFSLDRAVTTVRQALELTALRREVAAARESSSLAGSNVIGESPRMQEVFALLRRLATADTATVLIEGESGTGKGAIAQALHRMGRRAAGPFVNVQCAALPETLMESELFGHEKGAFTDAHTSKRGLVEMAAGGTLFLDEIGELTPGTQAKLLRFIEEKTFRRLGGTKDLTVDTRIMTATNRDLAAEAAAGRFRSDLYYRLRVIPIVMPPLRERPEDVALLARHFAAHFGREFAKRIGAIAPDALALLAAYRWPGNVRELRNVMERAVLLTDGGTVGVDELPPEVVHPDAPAASAAAGPEPGGRLAETERRLLVDALGQSQQNQSKAALLLGISRHQLRTRMKRYGLLAALLAFAAVPAAAQGPRRARAAGAAVSVFERQESAACDLCHGDREVLRRSAPRGWNPDSLFVTPGMLRGGAHEAIPCVRCHPLRGTLPHPDEPRSAVPCATCHAHADSLWRRGPHHGLEGRQPRGVAKEGVTEASCVSCHGTHAMRMARELEAGDGLRELTQRCASCHPDRALPAGDVHQDTVSCAQCHGAHMIQPVRDPATRGIPIGIADRCAQCHDSVATQARVDVHGALAHEQALGLRPIAGDTAATCVACHGGHNVRPARALARELDLLDRCEACHREEAESYADTYHGRATRLRHYKAARCDDCHTGHRVWPETDARSSVAPDQLARTCGQCHDKAARRPSFVLYRAHVVPHSPSEHPAVFGTWLFMNILLGSVFTVFGLHTVFWLKRLLELKWQERQLRIRLGLPKERKHVPLDSSDRGEGPYVWRFRLVNRLLHGVSVVSFFALIITGLPLRFTCAVWAVPLMNVLGGPTSAGIIHRVAGAVTILYFAWHIGDVLVRITRSKDRKRMFWGPDSMVPQPQDVRDFVQMWKWFFGKAEFPRFPRYGYNEKFHYLGAFWGIILLGATGLIRWFPEVATLFLPGWAFNAAAIVHADEAILASGFMFIIHFFNVHMRPGKFPMDGVMFTGRVRLEELAKDHALTAEAIGDVSNAPVSRRAVPDLVAPPPPRWMTYAAALGGLGALAVGLVIVGMVLWVQLC